MKKYLKISVFFLICPIFPLILFLIFYFCFENKGYILFAFVALLICIVTDYLLFAHFTRKAHNIQNDDFKIDLKELKQKEGVIEVNFLENKWMAQFLTTTLEFDLKDYFLPKSFIATYFMRQFQFIEINERHWQLRYLFKMYPIEKLKRSELREVYVRFHYKNKTKIIQVIKNYIPQNRGLKRIINRAPYYWAGGHEGGPGILYDRIKNLDEKKYWREACVKEKNRT